MHFRPDTLFLAGILVTATTLPLAAQNGAVATRTTQDTVFSEAQAERGRGVFSRVCSECHTRGQFTASDGFQLDWDNRTFLEAVGQLRATMPQNDPGSLTRRDYVDILTYLLRENGVPTGATDLATTDEGLQAVRIVLPTGGGHPPDRPAR